MPQRCHLYKLVPILADGVLRVGGRLENANLAFDLKHPIILPYSSYLTQLIIIIEQAHSQYMGHCGDNTTLNNLCQRFWTLNAKIGVCTIIICFVVCKKRYAKPTQQFMADIPSARFQVHEPSFMQVGVDYFCPLLAKVKRSDEKRHGMAVCLHA